ncbi:hypothetical protein SLA2020_142530 [Shorea laevis]
MPTATLPLISSSSSAVTNLSRIPPNAPNSNQCLSIKHRRSNQFEEERCLQDSVQISRRDAAFLSVIFFLPSVTQPQPASAFSIGISGPKNWLKEQKKKSAKFLLAPIDASREILRSVYLLLMATDSNDRGKNLEEVQNLLRSAARDCVPQEWNSFVAFQANTGVEVCTFRLIVKNASSLLEDKNPVKLEAEAMLNDLIRSFTVLNGLANETNYKVASSREKVADALMDTITSLNKLEQCVEDCLKA